ncbi:type I-F CRISPR-associated protein Csy1 [Serratia marcescens]|uniref:type I-F CRISPR-associated protein Csy1 n=1 Tax=Serratia marcescens TaxID=615 RepID=UPI0007451E76|nr:type I-F CRISPR-associated protein Csy1 [Serratia marcescens]CUY07325.1 CRISPR type I-F/YPEST-associated protein Csy1 [Serratia marcescens]CUZ17604.1 CRISPR type I-F/YPEST-associated protein Csy1 [Serratia marcescens]CUZ87091.1 CRISPR type I-F/YPEST-associated protein Csy1 [Serratia marcescens]CVA10766.1 CRISPR type I-F/YPEST-associated protein Csy1 [Serratia marcescens]CVB71873.1 CRISPR type I-F/YPEST-associated protein Csy1 [Serratia marcescens]
MPQQGLASFIVTYIEGRRQPKLEAFDKDAQKKLAAATEAEQGVLQQQLAQERRDLEQRYEVRAWLTDAAARAGQISLVTHAAKYTHSDAKGSSVYGEGEGDERYLSTAALPKPAVDAVGNAAALDVAKLLQTEHQGDSLLACLQRQDHSALAELAETPQQLEQWISGFSQALINKQPSSHKLAKQIYFPVGDGYHLLSPLFSSSLAQALHDRLLHVRFSDETKEANQARRAGQWHPEQLTYFPQTAVMNMGGTKPQNISYLNSVRGGRVWLLPCTPPEWQSLDKPPYGCKSIFERRGPFSYLVRGIVAQLRHFLLGVQERESTKEIRRRRQDYIDQIIDMLFNVVADIQREEWRGWSSQDGCELKAAQRLWLDPFRSIDDELFRAEREKEAWQIDIADDFAVWLNRQLSIEPMNMGMVERRDWRAAPLFRQRLRELEDALAEDLK